MEEEVYEPGVMGGARATLGIGVAWGVCRDLCGTAAYRLKALGSTGHTGALEQPQPAT